MQREHLMDTVLHTHAVFWTIRNADMLMVNELINSLFALTSGKDMVLFEVLNEIVLN